MFSIQILKLVIVKTIFRGFATLPTTTFATFAPTPASCLLCQSCYFCFPVLKLSCHSTNQAQFRVAAFQARATAAASAMLRSAHQLGSVCFLSVFLLCIQVRFLARIAGLNWLVLGVRRGVEWLSLVRLQISGSFRSEELFWTFGGMQGGSLGRWLSLHTFKSEAQSTSPNFP